MSAEAERRVVDLLRQAASEVQPPPGAWTRTLNRASTTPPRRSIFGRLVFAASTLLPLLTATGFGVYASPADAPLFPVQRAIDEAALALPRSADAHAQIVTDLAQKRVVQAAVVAPRAPHPVVKNLLEDAATLFTRARKSVDAMPAHRRAVLLGDLVAAYRRAAGELEAATQVSSANVELLVERAREFLEDAMEDEADQRKAEREADE